MRKVFQMVIDVANELNKESTPEPVALNERMAAIKEAYGVLDSHLSSPGSQNTSVLKEAMATADFPLYFGTAISRSFYAAYPQATGMWRDYTFADETPDFRDVDRQRTSETDGLVRRIELGQAKSTNVTSSQWKYHVDEYARAFGLSWRAIVNDDLGEIRAFPQKLLRAATRFEDSFVSNLYDNSTLQAALASLGTTYRRTSCALTVANLMVAHSDFAARKDAKGNPLNIRPKYLVTHPFMELTAREILSGIDATATMPNYTRVTKDLLEWRGDPYIGTATDWYLLADPAEIPAVSVLRMRGYDRPTVYLKSPNMVPFGANGAVGAPSWLTGDFENGEIEFMVLDIMGGWADATYTGVTDYLGIWSGSA